MGAATIYNKSRRLKLLNLINLIANAANQKNYRWYAEEAASGPLVLIFFKLYAVSPRYSTDKV